MYYAILALAALLTYFSMRNSNVLLRMASSIAWLAMAFWAILDADSPFDVSDGWAVMLIAVMVSMAFVPILIHMDTEITREYKGMRWAERRSRSSLKEMIQKDTPSAYESYRMKLSSRLSSGRKRRF